MIIDLQQDETATVFGIITKYNISTKKNMDIIQPVDIKGTELHIYFNKKTKEIIYADSGNLHMDQRYWTKIY